MKLALALAVLALPFAAIAQDDAATEQPAHDLAWHNRQQAAIAELKAEDGWQVLPGGLKWRHLTGDGSGPKPTVEDTVTVHYAGRLLDGTQFDSSYDRGEPATFPLGRLVKAWQLAIPQMGVGDTIELYTPADLAYGPVGKGPIPGNATLVFKVELLGIE
ncbi:peptidylprolyl isomerase [Citromicrobium sp. RCC1885]|uniref:FKBP-type peptidyl-prolyl cis-trans isomerase n=1 Tax=unclassified Citromicrobium TaxID=2630544 RepID=UPI0006C91B36|nr:MULTISPECIES: FKBP-type peptidyl-prolyl cis-trans isomerase [unclassified Citromicrobium]KPM24440.1 peptidylprolyl isomerase [Citromicrobium sp. RCC1885]KPM27682.1 peptidylprolyl isomerase [Citromicrobium sp. RCC1878]MAO05030.1 peptidylprolyl isomerase [Citromicrobium sp.]OAM10825.1 peptidylprolyl isomerase [Citromicrobium sp. RCC1897]